MKKLSGLLAEFGQGLCSPPSTDSGKEAFRQIVVDAVMISGWVSLLKTGVKVGVRSKSKAEGREITPEDVIAELINDMSDSKEIDVNELLKLIGGK